MTWNLFVTIIIMPLCSMLLGIWVNRQFKLRDDKDEKAEALKKELEKEKADKITKIELIKEEAAQKVEAAKESVAEEWRKNQSKILCQVKTMVENIEAKLDTKVNKDDCAKNEQWAEISKIKDKLINYRQ